MDLKALDAASEVDPGILLIADGRKGKGRVIGADVRTEATTKGIIAREEVIEVGRRLADWREGHVALLAAGLESAVGRLEVQGVTGRTATRKRPESMWGTGEEAREKAKGSDN